MSIKKTLQESLDVLKKIEQCDFLKDVYYVIWFGECVEIFKAKSILSAKRKTSKFCYADSDLHKAACVRLLGWDLNEVGVFSPRDGKWY